MSDERPVTTLKTTAPIVIGVVAVFAILVVVLVAVGAFDKGTTENDVSVVAAMLTLLGGLIASAFTLVGVLLKHSIDRHSARLADETENRLRLETSIKAVELLTLDDGTLAPPARQAGALFVLGSEPLVQLDLALALLTENWRTGKVTSSAAVWVVDRALSGNDPNLQTMGAATLRNHVDLLPSKSGREVDWPACVSMAWPPHITYHARVTLLETIAALLSLRRPEQWGKGLLNSFILLLDLIRRSDQSPEVRGGATLLLDVGLEWYSHNEPEGGAILSTGLVHFKDLRAEILPLLETARTEASQPMLETVEQLRTDWA